MLGFFVALAIMLPLLGAFKESVSLTVAATIGIVVAAVYGLYFDATLVPGCAEPGRGGDARLRSTRDGGEVLMMAGLV